MDNELGLPLDPESLFPHCLPAEVSQLPVPSVISGQMKHFLLGVKTVSHPYKASFSGRDVYFDPLIDNNMTVSHKSNYLPGDKKELCVDDFSLQREQVDRARQEVIPDRIKSKVPEKSWVLKCCICVRLTA